VLFSLPSPNEKIKVAIVIGDPEPLGEVIGPYGGAVALVYAGRYAGRCIRRVLTRSGLGIPTQRTVWPSTPEEMDRFLGIEGKRIPDSPMTPGRNKVVWQPFDRITITFEAHPYDRTAGPKHRDPHWHIHYHGVRRDTFVPGDPVPGFQK
jgi:pimeloyl-ACP methyl ester carboxylesterase